MTYVRSWLFAPIDTAPMAALRIACGLLTLGWALSLLPDIDAFLSDDGLTSGPIEGARGFWTLPLGNPYAAVGLLIVAAVMLTLGLFTKASNIVVALLLVVLQRRDVYMLNSGDLLLRELALYLCLMPSGEVWSLDARRRGSSELRAPWGLRMLQMQVSMLYAFSVIAKLHGDTWQDGSAVGRALQLGDLQRLVVPEGLSTSVAIVALLTYGTIVVETALAICLWLPRAKYVAMALGVSIHLGIEATLLIGWFSLTVISTYLAFVPGDVLRRGLELGRRRLTRASSDDRSTSLPASTSA
jgi:hypothetical protein